MKLWRMIGAVLTEALAQDKIFDLLRRIIARPEIGYFQTYEITGPVGSDIQFYKMLPVQFAEPSRGNDLSC